MLWMYTHYRQRFSSLAILYVLLKLVFLLTHLSHIMYRQAKSRVTNSTTLTVGGIEVTREVRRLFQI